ncbi:MAG: DNA polymerase IV [Gammaproteobacteria bacterium]|jgi:DNA polymerase-4
MRRILHLDMDAFFTAIESRRHPEFKDKPLVVGGRGDPNRRGVVATASYEARRFGIHSGMPLRTAFRLCPEAIFLPVDFQRYEAVSAQIKAIAREYSPVVEDAGIDECYLDISQVETSALSLAQELKRRIKDATGLSCSIGIAPNKLVAKIASDMHKPDGVTIITGKDIEERIWPLPVRRLLGVGPKTEARLKELHICTIGDLAAVPVATLIARFGPAHGEYLRRAARGIDDSPLVTHWEPRSMGRETTFEADISDRQVLAATLLRLTRAVVRRMQQEGYHCRRVTVILRYADFETHTHSLPLPAPTDDGEIIQETALDCLHLFPLTKKLRLVGIRLGELQKSVP